MSRAVVVAGAATEVESVAVQLRLIVPDHWTGRAAEAFAVRSVNLATGMQVYADQMRAFAAQVTAYEREVAATRAALAGAGMAAV